MIDNIFVWKPFLRFNNDLIREMVNISPTITICLSRTQAGGLPQ
jgi:hypothetical protein